MATACRSVSSIDCGIIPNHEPPMTVLELKEDRMTVQSYNGKQARFNCRASTVWRCFFKSNCILVFTESSHRTFSLKFAVLPVACCSPCGPSPLSLNMIHGAVPSLSLINNETNSKEKTQRYNLQLGYLSHCNCEEGNISYIWKVIWRTEMAIFWQLVTFIYSDVMFLLRELEGSFTVRYLSFLQELL